MSETRPAYVVATAAGHWPTEGRGPPVVNVTEPSGATLPARSNESGGQGAHTPQTGGKYAPAK